MKLSDRMVFVCTTSDDGIIGVYSSMRKLIEACKKYASQQGKYKVKIERFDDGRFYRCVRVWSDYGEVSASYTTCWMNQK